MDAAVADWSQTPGVFGARMTGGGFGGCVVAIGEPGALSDGWNVVASDGARCSTSSITVDTTYDRRDRGRRRASGLAPPEQVLTVEANDLRTRESPLRSSSRCARR